MHHGVHRELLDHRQLGDAAATKLLQATRADEDPFVRLAVEFLARCGAPGGSACTSASPVSGGRCTAGLKITVPASRAAWVSCSGALTTSTSSAFAQARSVYSAPWRRASPSSR